MITEFETKKIKVADIKLDGDNPNSMDNQMQKRLNGSFEAFGNTQDIVIDSKTMILADGEHRLKEYINKGITEIPAKLVPFESDAHRRAYRQAANKIHGEHDPLKDAEEFARMMNEVDNELINTITGMKYTEVEEHIRQLKGIEDDEQFDEETALEAIKDPVTKKGDVIMLGNHRLMCGDSNKTEDVAILTQEDTVDLLFTDPPYGIDIVKPNGKIGFGKGKLGFKEGEGSIDGGGIVPVGKHKKIIGDDKPFDAKFLMQFGSNQIIWGGNYFASKLKETSCWVIWDKRGDIPSNNFADCEIAWTSFKKPSRILTHKWSGLIREGNREEEMVKRCHPTQKPVGLHIKILDDYSKDEEIIMDLFGGSGTTLIACEQTNRKCIMMEIDPTYCDVIINRWEALTEKEAKRL